MEDPVRKPFIGQLAVLHKKWMEMAQDDARLRDEQLKVAELKALTGQAGREDAIKQSQ